MPDPQGGAQPRDMGAAQLAPGAQHGCSGWRDFTRRLEPTLDQSILQSRVVGSDAPVTGSTLHQIPVLAQDIQSGAGRSGTQRQSKALVSALMLVDELAHRPIVRLHRIAGDATIISEGEPHGGL